MTVNIYACEWKKVRDYLLQDPVHAKVAWGSMGPGESHKTLKLIKKWNRNEFLRPEVCGGKAKSCRKWLLLRIWSNENW